MLRLFEAEGEYAESMVCSAMGDIKGSVAALKRALKLDPNYAPALLTLASIEYQLRRDKQGWKLLESLLALPENAPDLLEIIDKAGTFLIDCGDYREGLELYRTAAGRFPSFATFHDGVSCCASHQGFPDEAMEAARRALQLDPDNQKYVNNLGWSLFLGGNLEQGRAMLQRAVSMDPSDRFARENLRLCKAGLTQPEPGPGSDPVARPPRSRRRKTG